MFFVTLVHVLPPSRVSCTWPSLVPAQISPFSIGDSAIAIDDEGVLDADVVAGEPAGKLLARSCRWREIGADHLPALAAIRRTVDVLAADVQRVVIVRRHRERHRPVEAILEFRRGAIRRCSGHTSTLRAWRRFSS